MSVLEQFGLRGRRTLVTGATAGLGFEIAAALGDAGAELIIVGRDETRLADASRRLAQRAPQVSTVRADLASLDAADAMCDEVLARHAPIDILVNNVGGRRINFPTEEMPLDEWKRILDLNLNQAFVCTKRIGGAMLERRRGRVINVSSISASIPGRQMRGRSYETAKAALSMFTKAVAADWAPSNVTVNAIAPGAFLTDANKRWFADRPELREDIESGIPMGRMGRPEEIGALAVFLASDASSYVTGSVFVIDGGRLLW